MVNRRGGINLMCNGYLYTTERKYNKSINWVCNKNSNSRLRCPARCITSGKQMIKFGQRLHNHEPIIVKTRNLSVTEGDTNDDGNNDDNDDDNKYNDNEV